MTCRQEIVKIISFQKKKKSEAFFNILTEPLPVQKQMIPQLSSDTKLFADGKSKGVALSRGLHAHLLQKDIVKKVNFTEQSQNANFFLIAPILCILIL